VVVLILKLFKIRILLHGTQISATIASGTIYVCSDYVMFGLPEVVVGAENPQGISNIPKPEKAPT
jgi:hypothetical protein